MSGNWQLYHYTWTSSNPILLLLTGVYVDNLPLLWYTAIRLHFPILPVTLQLIQLQSQHRETHTQSRSLKFKQFDRRANVATQETKLN